MLKDNIAFKIASRAKQLSSSVAWFDAFTSSNELKEFILNAIRQDQLFDQGIDAKGDVIGYYSLTTSLINASKAFNTHYTLRDTGDFYASMYIVVLMDELLVVADADKMEDQKWWHTSILELTENNTNELANRLRDKYIQYAKRILFESR